MVTPRASTYVIRWTDRSALLLVYLGIRKRKLQFVLLDLESREGKPVISTSSHPDLEIFEIGDVT